jgi:hypothetical protein
MIHDGIKKTEGIKIVVNDLTCISYESKQFRFPKSKKTRIRNKWKKRKENYRIEKVHRAIKINDIMFVSSKIYEQILNSEKVLEY